MQIIKANEKLEDEIKLAESKKREEFNAQKKAASSNRTFKLTAQLHDCIPLSKQDYAAELQKYSEKATCADRERTFIELNLKLNKIRLRAKKIPAKNFTVSELGKKLELDILRTKLLAVLS